MGDQDEPRRTSRREVLKKGAIVAGMAWTVPVIQSVRTPAFAGSPPPCLPNGGGCADNAECCSGVCDPGTHLCRAGSPCVGVGGFCAGPFGGGTCCAGLRCLVSGFGTPVGICVPNF